MTKTQSGTLVVDGVEYGSYPPPIELLKAMKRRWAEALVEYGQMRFGSLASYRQWENVVLGDPNDGQGMFRMSGHPYQTGSANAVYAWCASMPGITAERTLLLAQHCDYDCVVRVHKPLVLIRRVHSALVNVHQSLLLHCSEVSYDRGGEVNTQTLNSQKFHFNVFQKDAVFSPDMEYRLSLTDACLRAKPERFVEILVGDCSDIIAIEELPKSAIQPGAAAQDLPDNSIRPSGRSKL